MTPELIVKMSFLGIVIIALGILVFIIGRYSGDKNNLDNIQSSLGVIFASTLGVLVVLAGLTFLYLGVNPQAFVPMTIILMYLNLQLSLVAVGVSVIQRT